MTNDEFIASGGIGPAEIAKLFNMPVTRREDYVTGLRQAAESRDDDHDDAVTDCTQHGHSESLTNALAAVDVLPETRRRKPSPVRVAPAPVETYAFVARTQADDAAQRCAEISRRVDELMRRAAVSWPSRVSRHTQFGPTGAPLARVEPQVVEPQVVEPQVVEPQVVEQVVEQEVVPAPSIEPPEPEFKPRIAPQVVEQVAPASPLNAPVEAPSEAVERARELARYLAQDHPDAPGPVSRRERAVLSEDTPSLARMALIGSAVASLATILYVGLR